MPVLSFYLLVYLSRAGYSLVAGLLGEAHRRMTGAYRFGYAIVPDDANPGDVLGPGRFIVARDPISLPARGMRAEIARVADVAGFRSSYMRAGWFWEATSARIVERVPSWVVFGPSGRTVIEVIATAMTIPEEATIGVVPTLDGRHRTSLLHGDAWRTAVAGQIQSAVDLALLGRAAWRVRTDLAPEDIDGTADWTDAMQRTFDTRLSRTSGAIAVIVNAALAAAFAEELQPADVERFSVDWQRVVEWHADPAIESRGVLERAVRIAKGPLNLLERHPVIGVAITVAIIFPMSFVSPLAGLVLLVVMLSVAPIVLIRRRITRGRRIGRRRWEPGADIDHEVPSPERIRRAMSSLGRPTLAVTTRHLVWLLRPAEVWVALKGPSPSEPDRSLAWLKANGQPLPIDLRRTMDGPVVLVYTDAERHRSAEMAEPIAWTTKVPFEQAASLSHELGAAAIAIDAGCDPTTWVNAAGFGLFLSIDPTAEASETSEEAS